MTDYENESSDSQTCINTNYTDKVILLAKLYDLKKNGIILSRQYDMESD